MNSSAPDEFTGTDRFEVRRRLGAGGMGVVYEAFDRKRDLVVALKTIQNFNASALYRFKKEFRALEEVVHPNLVRLWELFSDGDRWFFTMELVEGTDFLHYVRPDRHEPVPGDGLAETETFQPMPKGRDLASTEYPKLPSTWPDAGRTSEADTSPEASTETESSVSTLLRPEPAGPRPGGPPGLDVPRLRSALRQLAGALVALHAMGKVHRDIKPSNVMVGWTGRVVVLDFGLSTELRGEDDPQKTEHLIVGTIPYMAPEQGAELPLTPASDWYSVGVMLYRVLTGRMPYTGTRLQLMTRKQLEDPPHPASIVEGLPDDLCSLCMDLLRRAPGDRPTGQEVLRRLGCDSGESMARRWAPAPQGRPFLGRETHLAALREAFASTRKGRATAAFVHGRSGAGKSALVHHFLAELAGRGDVVILQGRCFEQESVAYKALDALIDSLSHHLRRLSRLEAEALLPRDIATLARVFPVLKRVEAVANAPLRHLESPDKQELRRRAFSALRELLARMADRRPLVLYIDDLHWGDLDSADLLAELVRPPDAPALLLLCCYRSEHGEASSCLLRLLAPGEDEVSGPERREVMVEALTPDEARDLARLLLGKNGPVPEYLVEMVARESSGSPYFVYELAHYLTEGGEFTDSLELAGTASLEEVIWRRVRELPREPRRLLEAISLAGRPICQAVASRAAGLGADGFGALALLRANNLVRGSGPDAPDEVEAYHDRIRETVTRRLSPEDRMAWHRLLARELEQAGGADPETLAVHLEAAGQPAGAGRYYAQAAAAAVEALAFDRAAKLYRRVLELRSPSDPEDPSIRVRLAEALANAGRGFEAAEIYLEAAAEADDADVHELQSRAAYQFLISGHIDEGQAAFREVLARVGLHRPATPNQALMLLLKERIILAVRGLGFRPRAAEDVAPRVLACVDTARAVAVGISVVDVVQGSYFQTRSLRLALRAGEPFRIALALGWEAVHSACRGRNARRRTGRLIALSESVANRVGHPHAIAMATLSAGAADYFAGRFPAAVTLLDRAAQLFREQCTGVGWELDTSQVFGLWARIYQGEFAEMASRFQALDQEARERGDRYMESTLGTYPGVLARLAADQPDEARELGDGAIAQWSQHGFHVQHLTHYYGNTYIDLYEGNGEAAWRRAERTWPEIRASLLPRIQHVKLDVLQLRGRSAVAAAAQAQDPGPLLLAAEASARQLDREKMEWGQAVATLIRAGVCSIRGDEARYKRLLVEALSRAEAAHLGLFAAAARRRLGSLLGGDEGREQIARADAWMAGQNIKDPARMVACLAPVGRIKEEG